MIRIITASLSLVFGVLVIVSGIFYFVRDTNPNLTLILLGINLFFLGAMFTTFTENEIGKLAKPVGIVSILIGLGITLLVIFTMAGLI